MKVVLISKSYDDLVSLVAKIREFIPPPNKHASL